jgi:hypothetical protein
MNNENTLPDVHFKHINAQTVVEICKLSETLSPQQRLMVTDNAISIAQAHFSENAWTSVHLGEQSPEAFYKGLGFEPTGEYYGDEPELKLQFS